MHLQESGEMYLETIYVLSQSSNHVRSIDVANELGFTKPSVSVAMKQLRENYEGMNIGSVVADSGYESEENYTYYDTMKKIYQELGCTTEYLKKKNNDL